MNRPAQQSGLIFMIPVVLSIFGHPIHQVFLSTANELSILPHLPPSLLWYSKLLIPELCSYLKHQSGIWVAHSPFPWVAVVSDQMIKQTREPTAATRLSNRHHRVYSPVHSHRRHQLSIINNRVSTLIGSKLKSPSGRHTNHSGVG